MAGLSAAFELTRTESLRERFEVTVYQPGWRLGGKCASGVDDQGRNIEHGLHIWFGYYENTFALLDAVYDAWRPPPGQRITRLADAIHPQPFTPIGDGAPVDPDWYRVCFPPNHARPGKGERRIETWDSLLGVLELVALFATRTVGEDAALANVELPLSAPPPLARLLGAADPRVALVPRPMRVADTAGYLQDVAWAGRQVKAGHPHYAQPELEAVVGSLRALSEATRVGLVRSAGGALLAEQFDLVAAFAAGIVADVLLGQQPIAQLDGCDFRHWLVRHGASVDSVERSRFVAALYDTMFQYPQGDHARPRYGAGTAAQVVLRMLGTYAGALAWKPAAGTGQAVVAPLYQVLQQRGVRFRFFHKLVDVVPAPNEDALDALRFERQVELVDESREYRPVRMEQGLLSWGAEPDWAVIRGGPELRAAGVDFESHWCTRSVGTVTLRRGSCFDEAILAVPLGAFKRLNADRGPCEQLMARSERFRRMADRQRLVPSVSVQAWCLASLAQLGWGCSPAAVAGPRPLGIWADMSELLPYEGRAPDGGLPASLHYFCEVLRSDLYRRPVRAAGTQAEADAQARALVAQWFEAQAPSVWANVGTRGHFDWDVLYSPSRGRGPGRLDDQVVRANVDPGSCCVSSAPGTTRLRLKCDASGLDHLYLAGSWIDTGFNTECIEAAVMSGLQAARAITGEPREIPGEHFLHPEYDNLSLCDLVRDSILRGSGCG
jgi:uncharacterized protein with NAD-binding domain and iron-sulfur cluster